MHDEGWFGVGGARLYRQSWKPRDAADASKLAPVRAALLVVHGFGEHSGRYSELAGRLVARGYAVYAYDRRGHGRSDGRRGDVSDWSDYLDEIEAMFAHVVGECGERPIFLLGQSMGGLIVLDYALAHRSRIAGVIASGTVLARPNVGAWRWCVARFLKHALPGLRISAGVNPDDLSRDADAVAEYIRDPLVHNRGTPRLAMAMLEAIDRVVARASEFSVPTFMLHGHDDRLAPAEASRAFFDRMSCQDKEFRLDSGGYHEPFHDLDRNRAIDDVADWLDRHV